MSTVHVKTTVTDQSGKTGSLEGDVTLNGGPPPPTGQTIEVKEYLGAFRMNEDASSVTFAYGGLGGRRNPQTGKLTFFMALTDTFQPSTVVEISDPEVYSKDWQTAPQCNRVQWTGDICKGKKGTWMTSVQRDVAIRNTRNLLLKSPNPILEGWLNRLLNVRPRATGYTWYEFYPGQAPLGSLLYDDETNAIYWTYADGYNVSGRPDWALGACVLNDDGTSGNTYGPWRMAGTDKDNYTRQGSWVSGFLAKHPNGNLITGTTIQSGSVGSPWGPEGYTGRKLPALTDDPMIDQLMPTRLLRHYYMGGLINSDGVASGPVMSMRRNKIVPYWEPFNGVGALNINQAHYNGTTSWRQCDVISGVQWIDYKGKTGLVYTGLIAGQDAHEWYSNVGVGALNCPAHNVAPPVQITGPVCTNMVPVFIVYPLSEIDRIARGEIPDYGAEPSQFIDVEKEFGVHIAPEVVMAPGFNNGYFDKETGRYFVLSQRADDVTVWGTLTSLVHVFQLG